MIPEFIKQMIDKKLLGNKTKAGFYKTDLTPEWKKIRKVINPATMEYEDLTRPSFPCLDAAKRWPPFLKKLNAYLPEMIREQNLPGKWR